MDRPELRAACDDWRERVATTALLADGPALGDALSEADVVIVGYRTFRDRMRALSPLDGTAASDRRPEGRPLRTR